MAKFNSDTHIPKLLSLIQAKEALERWLDMNGWPNNILAEEGKTGVDADTSRRARIEGIKHKLEVIDKEIWEIVLTTKT